MHDDHVASLARNLVHNFRRIIRTPDVGECQLLPANPPCRCDRQVARVRVTARCLPPCRFTSPTDRGPRAMLACGTPPGNQAHCPPHTCNTRSASACCESACNLPWTSSTHQFITSWCEIPPPACAAATCASCKKSKKALNYHSVLIRSSKSRGMQGQGRNRAANFAFTAVGPLHDTGKPQVWNVQPICGTRAPAACLRR